MKSSKKNKKTTAPKNAAPQKNEEPNNSTDQPEIGFADLYQHMIEEKAAYQTKKKATWKIKDLVIAIVVALVAGGGCYGYFALSNYFNPDNTPEPTPIPSPLPSPSPAPDPEPKPAPAPAPEPTPDPAPEPAPEPVPGIPYIDGPDQAAVGDLVVLSLHNADVASWSVVPTTPSYIDTGQSALVLASSEARTVTVFVSTISDGHPYALTQTIKIGDDDGDGDDADQDGDDAVKRLTLDKWSARYLPVDAADDYAGVAGVFDAAIDKVADGTLATEAAVWAFANGRLKAACHSASWDKFLADLTERLKTEDCDTAQSLAESFKKIAAGIRSKIKPSEPAPAPAPAPTPIPAPSVIRIAPASSVPASSGCASGNCPIRQY